MTYSIVYTKQATLNEAGTDLCDGSATKVIVTVTSVVGFADKGIFVYMIDPVTLSERYSHVATPCDLQAYNYLVVGGLQYVRRDQVTIVYATAELASEGVASIESSMTDLVNDMEALDVLGTLTTSTISS